MGLAERQQGLSFGLDARTLVLETMRTELEENNVRALVCRKCWSVTEALYPGPGQDPRAPPAGLEIRRMAQQGALRGAGGW